MEDIIDETVLDIDVCDANNPLAVVDYIEDLYAYYRKTEVNLEMTSLNLVHFSHCFKTF